MDYLENVLSCESAPSAAEPEVLAMVGPPLPSIVVYDGLGIFEKRKERINGAPSFSLVGGDEMICLWRVLNDFEGWFIGNREYIGKAHGSFRVRGAQPTPDVAGAHWEVVSADGKEWAEAPGVRCISGEAVQAGLDAAPKTMALVGSTPHHLQRDCLGLFERTDKIVNGYPLYALVGNETRDLLWHVGSCWIVGNRPDIGSNVGGMVACDGALRPDAVQAPWAVMGLQNEWVAAPNVEVIVGSKLNFELSSAARTVALVGATPRAQNGFLGVFERMTRTVNGLATYRMKSDDPDAPPVLLWHANACWLVGSMAESSSHRDGAQLRVSDGALRPECIEAMWEVWDDKQDAWVEAPALRCLPRHAVVKAVEEVEMKDELIRRLEVSSKGGAGGQRMRRTASAVTAIRAEGVFGRGRVQRL